MSEWTRARRFWLGTASSEHTRRAYEFAADDFGSFIAPCCYGEVGGATISEYAAELRARGCSEATIRARLAALSSFYRYCSQTYTSAAGEPLARHNPVAQVKRPRVARYGNSRPLEVGELRDLLGAIDRGTVMGMRDYALILMAVYTGRRSAEIRGLRWGDIACTMEGKRRYAWRGKGGKARWDDMPEPVYQAIVLYLEAAGRWPLKAGDPVFVAHNGRDAASELSGEWFNQLVKRYARLAGLGEWVHAHTLRHTAAHVRVEAGRGLMEISWLLGHSSLETTQRYLKHMRGFVDEGWRDVETLLQRRGNDGQVSNQVDVCGAGVGDCSQG